ncbi:Flagellar L-ring protein [Stutzerimonas stutzeri]
MPGEEGLGQLKQGVLEGSNVQVVEAMVAMIAIQRAYEANAKVLDAASGMQQFLNQTVEPDDAYADPARPAVVAQRLRQLQRVAAGPEDFDEYEPLELDYSLPPTTSGGLFRSGYGGSLISDRRAVRVGDILTVVLDESTQSSKSAGTSFGKESSIGIGIPTVLGKRYPDVEQPRPAGEREFDGSAKSSQQNTLRGSIAVTGHRVLPNGTLLVKGEKNLKLNQGDEYIRLTGLVRMDDIDRFNQVYWRNAPTRGFPNAGRACSTATRPAG